MGKQFAVDIVVSIAFPLLLIGAYYTFRGDNGALLSIVSSGVTIDPTDGGSHLGAKTEAALVVLNSIHFDDALFTDPAYLSLKEYRVSLPTFPLGRAYPFTLPQILIDRNKSARESASPKLQEITPQNKAAAQKIKDLKSISVQ